MMNTTRLNTMVAFIILIIGLFSITASILYSSTILAFIGLGLTFWGALLFYIKPKHYIQSALLPSTTLPILTTINQIIKELNLKGKAVYLPPRSLDEIRSGKAFIPSKKETDIPPSEELTGEKIFHENPDGILLTPPGVSLANLFEDTLGTSFTKVDLNYLQNNMPKLLIEDLEIAEDVEIEVKTSEVKKKLTGSISLIQTKNDGVYVKIIGSIYSDLCKKARELSSLCETIGCPLCSSIAVALSRITGKPVTIEEAKPSQDGETIEVQYRILEG